MGVVWAPTQDGGFFALKTEIYLPEMPEDLRRQGLFEKVPAIVGINAQDGAKLASECLMCSLLFFFFVQRSDSGCQMPGEEGPNINLTQR